MRLYTVKNLVVLLLFFIGAASATAALTDPVVIQNISDTYKFVPDKSGTALDRVEHTSKITLRANKKDATAAVLAYYNDFITIDKTSGDEKHFGSYISDDVFFDDAKACIMTAEIKKAGATRDVTYKRTYHKPEFFPGVMIIEHYDVENGEMIFEIPSSLAERYTLVDHRFPDSMFVKTTEEKNNTLYVKYTYKDLKKPKSYSDSPSLHLTVPEIIVLGHFKNTDELYKYLYSYIPKDDPGAAEVAAKAREITKDCNTDEERIKAITDFVHNTVRYVAVENGELGQKPDLASEVLRKAYGDCKGSASLIKEMLCSLGIDARRVWLGTDVIDTRWTDVPNVSSGNHMIAAVVNGDSITYIDGTLKYTSPGELAVAESGVQTIIEGDADNYIIGETPKCRPELYTDSTAWTVNIIPDTSTLSYTGSITITGMKRKGFISSVDDTAPAKRNDLYEHVLSRRIKGGHTRSATCSDTANAIVIEGTVEQTGAIKRAGKQMIVDINPAPNILNLRFTPSDRKTPGMMESTDKTVIVITLNVPEGMVADKLPSGTEINNKWVSAKVDNEISPDGRSVVRTLTLITRRGIVGVDDIKQFNAEIKQLNRACSANIVLKEAE